MNPDDLMFQANELTKRNPLAKLGGQLQKHPGNTHHLEKRQSKEGQSMWGPRCSTATSPWVSSPFGTCPWRSGNLSQRKWADSWHFLGGKESQTEVVAMVTFHLERFKKRFGCLSTLFFTAFASNFDFGLNMNWWYSGIPFHYAARSLSFWVAAR